MSSRFDTDTAVTARSEGREAPEARGGRDGTAAPGGSYDGRIDEGWWIIDGPNGGYVAAILLRAATATLRRVDDVERVPISVTCQYLRRPVAGPCRIDTAVERVGRTVATVTARMLQGDRCAAIATCASSAPREGLLEFRDLEPPEAPPPADCPPQPPPGEGMIPLNDRYESRWAFGPPPFTGADDSETGGWIRTEDAREVDHLLAVALADAWIPPVFSRLSAPGMLAVPTVEMSVYLRGGLPRPAGEYVLGSFRSRAASAGYVEEDGELWSEDGALLAQTRQLAAVIEVTG